MNQKTHYAYMLNGETTRFVTDTFNLDCANSNTRRKLIHELIDCGYLLAKIPDGFLALTDETIVSDLEYFLNREF